MEHVSTTIYIITFGLISSLIFVTLFAKRNNTTYLFTLVLICLLGWVFTLYIYFKVDSERLLLIVGRINFSFIIVLSPGLWFFINNFPSPTKIKQPINYIYIIESLIILFLCTFTSFIVKDEVIEDESRYAVYGSGYFVFIAHFVFYLFKALRKLNNNRRKAFALEKMQNNILFWSLILSLIWGATTNLINPQLFLSGLYNINTYTIIQNFGILSIFIFGLPVYFSVIKYKFLDIKPLIGNSFYYFALSAYSFVTFYILLILYNKFLGGVFTISSLIVGPFMAITFVVIYNFINVKLKDYISSRFIFSNFDPNDLLNILNQNLGYTLNLEDIFRITLDTLLKAIGTQKLAIAIKNKENIIYFTKTEEFKSLNYNEIFDNLKGKNTPDNLIISYFEQDSTKDISVKVTLKLLNYHGIHSAFKLRNNKEDLIGIILLGEKINNKLISNYEIQFIRNMSNLIELAITRSLLYEEVQNFNKTLQQKIKQATSELEEKNIALQEALRKEKDMMDIMGHELRTPLTIAQNAILMAEMRDRAGKLTEDKLHEMFEQTKEGIDREIKILDTILSSTRLENNRVPLNIEPIDAKDVVNDTIEGNRKNAEKKGLKLFTNMPLENVLCLADRAATQQIIDNLVSNAIKYTQIGSIEVTLQVEANWVKFSVKDTGEGIPKEEIKNLGKKFHRINPHLDSDGNIAGRKIIRPGGTGIGLFVVFEMTKLMKGKVEIESEVGKGSKFTVYLPKVISRSKTKEKKGTVRTSSNIE